MYIIHEQFQKSKISIFSIYVLMSFLLLFIIFKNFYVNIMTLVLILIFVFNIILLISFYKLTFRITSDGIEFGFGIFKRKIKKDKIQSVLIDSSIGTFFAYGIRFGKNKILGFIARPGEGLIIKTKYGLIFFVSLNDPKTALNIIKENNYV